MFDATLKGTETNDKHVRHNKFETVTAIFFSFNSAPSNHRFRNNTLLLSCSQQLLIWKSLNANFLQK